MNPQADLDLRNEITYHFSSAANDIIVADLNFVFDSGEPVPVYLCENINLAIDDSSSLISIGVVIVQSRMVQLDADTQQVVIFLVAQHHQIAKTCYKCRGE